MTSCRFAAASCRTFGVDPQKICRLHIENARELVDNVNSRGINAAFQRADIGTIDFGAMRELLLRQALGQSGFPQVPRKNLSNLHVRESNPLKSISPRSILYKTNDLRSLSLLNICIRWF